jgi:hypothetical protein
VEVGPPVAFVAGQGTSSNQAETTSLIRRLIVADEDLVKVRSAWTGKYTDSCRRTPVAGKGVVLVIVYTNVYRIAGGGIVDNWVGMDRLALAGHLGMKLAPASAGETN